MFSIFLAYVCTIFKTIYLFLVFKIEYSTRSIFYKNEDSRIFFGDDFLVMRTGLNNRSGWNFFSKIISAQGLISSHRVDFFLKNNKRTCSSIRHTRVPTGMLRQFDRCLMEAMLNDTYVH